MRVVDLNLLLYAHNPSAVDHDAARRWLEAALSGAATVGFSWMVLLGFARLSTKPGIMSNPMSIEASFDVMDGWLARSSSVVIEPTHRHASLVRDLLRAVGTGGNLVNDAHLAALALEHRGEVVSYDSDFGRFPGVRWSRPG